MCVVAPVCSVQNLPPTSGESKAYVQIGVRLGNWLTADRMVQQDGETNRSRCMFVHPNIPGDSTNYLVIESLAAGFEGELDLAMVVALMPDHVLQE